MSEIKILEKIVAPNASWATVDLMPDSAENTVFARKITFDRTYQYFWLWTPSPFGWGDAGIALTMADVERAAVFDDVGKLLKFDINADGIMTYLGRIAFCVAMGPKRSFYILSNMNYPDGGQHSSYPVYISAQDDAVCPFVFANPWL